MCGGGGAHGWNAELERSRGERRPRIGCGDAWPVARRGWLSSLAELSVARVYVEVCGGGDRHVERHEVLCGLCEGLGALEVGDAVCDAGLDVAIGGDGGVEVDGGEEGGEVGRLGGRKESHGRFP